MVIIRILLKLIKSRKLKALEFLYYFWPKQHNNVHKVLGKNLGGNNNHPPNLGGNNYHRITVVTITTELPKFFHKNCSSSFERHIS